MYLHYWYADYVDRHGDNRYGAFDSAKNTADFLDPSSGILQQEFQKRKSRMISGNPMNQEEFESLLDFFANPGDVLNNLRSETANGSRVENWSGISKSANTSSGVTPEQLAAEISHFCQELRTKTDAMIGKLTQNIEAYKTAVIQEYAESQGVRAGSGRFARLVIQDFIRHEGLKKIGLSTSISGGKNATLDTCVRACVLLAEALPSYGSDGSLSMGSMSYSSGSSVRSARRNGGSGMKRSGSGGATLQIILNKLNGLWSNVVGSGAEIAQKKGEEVLLKKLDKELKIIPEVFNHSGVSGGEISIDVRAQGDEIIKKTENIKGVSKPDVTISITDGSVGIYYGVNVKQYTPNPADNSIVIDSVKGTPFLEALRKHFPVRDNEYLFNLAGAHPGLGYKGKKGTGQAQSYAEVGLNQRWKDLVDSVAIRNFLDFIAGLGEQNGDNVLYCVINGNVYDLPSIMSYVYYNPNVVRGAITSGETNKTLYRGSLVKNNKWVGVKDSASARTKLANGSRSRELALQRSDAAYSAIYSQLEQAKLRVSVKMLLNIL